MTRVRGPIPNLPEISLREYSVEYVTLENVFEAIREAHEEGTKHGCRDILSKKIQQYYANITVKQLHAFVDCCEICKFKKGRMISTGGVRLTA